MKSSCFSIFATFFILFCSVSSEAQEKKQKAGPALERPHRIQLATYPALSPNGAQMAFGWAGDIWIAKSKGGIARRFTTHQGDENRPQFSPDGSKLAFNRSVGGQIHVFVASVKGGIPRQVTFHSSGSKFLGWYPDGKSVLISGVRDFGTRNPSRFYRVNVEKRETESLLFDAECVSGMISPDGKQLLFTREGFDLYRKGYRGTKSSQIWLAENLETQNPKFTKLIAKDFGARDPIWKFDGSGFYFTSNQGDEHQFNVWSYDFATKKEQQITRFDEDPVILPSMSNDGKTMVFRKEFDFFTVDLTSKNPEETAKKANFQTRDERFLDDTTRRILTKATNMSVSKDGLEIAFAAGGDIWVMDTVLKEPKQVTNTPHEEREPVFAPDSQSIYYIREKRGNMDIWSSKRADESKYAWQNDEFIETQITKSKLPKNDIQFLPTGKRISFVEGLGTLKTADPDGQNVKTHVESWNQPDYDFSPDGKWLAYAVSDNDFNRDIWIRPLDDHREPFNLSRHPDNDSSPRWSPDGKMIAFSGRRYETETDIYYVHLAKETEEVSKRKDALKSAIEKMKKERKPTAAPEPAKKPELDKPKEAPKAEPKKESPKPDTPASKKEPATPKADPAKAEPEPKGKPAPQPKGKSEPKPAPKTQKPEMVAAKEAPKSDKPAAPTKPNGVAKADPKPAPKASPKVDPAKVVAKPPVEPGKKVDPAKPKEPSKDKPKEVAENKESEKPEAKKPAPKKEITIDFDDLYERIRRISIPNSAEGGLFWSHDSKRLAFSATVKGAKGTYTVTFPDKLTPALLTPNMGGLARWDAKNDSIFWLVKGVPSAFSRGKAISYPFKAKQEYDRGEYQKAAFHQIWRTMRDYWYDENLNNKDWDAVLKKYEKAAADAVDAKAFERVAAMLLGELNGSHVGFRSVSSAFLSRSSNSIPGISWIDGTRHLGVKFDPTHKGAGIKIAKIIPGSYADRTDVDLVEGDVILKIDGESVGQADDLLTLLNGPAGEIFLTVKARKDDEKKDHREVTIISSSYSAATSLLQKERYKQNRKLVEKLSDGRLGYVHVSRMQWNEFIKFEEEIFARGAGKDGLIIDVRDNGGGFTADHLLTVLTPPRHALTVARGGGPGYPQDRLVYATWTKPIIVLCNQNSFSNAEIFSHAIKELGRGQLVGVQTAGGVISTGSKSIMDVGSLRLPFRGWYRLRDGADMELNGALPDHIVWPEPGDWADGRDRQIEKAVSVLTKEASQLAKEEKQPELVPVSEKG